MDIKEYLHLYFGCDCICSLWDSPSGHFITTVQWPELQHPERVKKLILRPLSDMTNAEHAEAKYILPMERDAWKRDAERTRYLLSRGFDLFGLIYAGLAIDAKEVENAK